MIEKCKIQNNITICAVINSVAVAIFCGFAIKGNVKLEGSKAVTETKQKIETESVVLSQNDQMKKEIAELKQALEMEDLKEEYTKLYKELKDRKNKE